MVQACVQAFVTSAMTLTFMGASVNKAPNMPNEDISPSRVCKVGDPDQTTFRYAEKIAYCERNVESSLKTEIYEKYGIPSACRGQFIIDHIIPLSIGGSNSEENLWPEHHKIRDEVNPVEEQVFADLSSGSITQAEAIRRILEVKFDTSKDYHITLNCN